MTGFGDALLRARIDSLANRVAALDELASVRIDPAPASPVIVRAVPERDLRGLRDLVGELVAQTPPDEVLRHQRGPFLERWHVRLAGAPSSEAMYVHRLVDRDVPPPHNHPWSSASLLLAGEIFERFTWRVQERWCGGSASLRPGDVVWRSAACTHLVVPRHGAQALAGRVAQAPVMVFATGPRAGAWGFLGPDGKFKPSRTSAARRAGGACRRDACAGRPEDPGARGEAER